MYNWVDDRRLSRSKNLPSFGLIPKNLNSFIRSRSCNWSSFSQLPVIEEEEGNVNDEEIEVKNYLLPAPSLSDSCQARKNINAMGNCASGILRKKEPAVREWVDASKSTTKLPPLVNINCLMNFDMKQSQIWETNFGRRLLNGKPPKITEPPSKGMATRRGDAKYGTIQPLSCLRNSIPDRNIKKGGGERENGIRLKSDKKKGKKINKDARNPSKKVSGTEKKQVKSVTEIKCPKSEEKSEETSRNRLPVESPTISSFSKNQHYLTECVRSILDSVIDVIKCEHCEETFKSVEELHNHMKKHEEEKEVCLLCDKVFYKPNDFIHHLLAHEGVDKFSCKKCKKYFPTQKKYQQHCKESHFMSSQVSMLDRHTQLNVEYVKKWLPKYECKRCKVEFDSEEAQRAHKKNHIKMDLTGAYLLCPKAI